MASSPSWLERLSEALGPVQVVGPLGGGAQKVLVGGQDAVAKVGPVVADEASGLRALASVAAGPRVPEVLFAEGDLMVTTFVAPGPRGPVGEEDLGRGLAILHSAGWAEWGGGGSWIGNARVDPSPAESAASFYGRRLSELAERCGLSSAVSPVVDRLEELLPPGGPALLHGDLWWGNVLWGAGGEPWLIDPSVHGGHPEEDLAMLGLFGDVPARLRDAYDEALPPLPGWRDRVALFQLYPLLVHSVLFVGGYRAQAVAVARRYA